MLLMSCDFGDSPLRSGTKGIFLTTFGDLIGTGADEQHVLNAQASKHRRWNIDEPGCPIDDHMSIKHHGALKPFRAPGEGGPKKDLIINDRP